MKSLVRCLLAGLGGGIVGWSSYDGLLGLSYPFDGSTLVSRSLQQALLHKIAFVASLVLLGVVLGFYAKKGLKVLSFLLIVAIFAMISWLFFVRQKMENIHGSIQGSTDLISTFKLEIDAIPMYGFGLVATLAVVLVVVVLSLIKTKRGPQN